MPKKIFFILFVIIWFLPPIVKYFEWDSYTFSTVACVSLFTILYLMFHKKLTFERYFLRYFSLLFFVIILNVIITSLVFSYEFDIGRALASIFFMMVFLVGAYCVSKGFLRIEKGYIDTFFSRLLYFYFLLIILSFFTQPIFSNYAKSIFPYSEPSHLALFFAPVFCYNVINSRNVRRRFILMLGGLAIALIIKNLTFLLTVFIIAIFVYNLYFLPIGIIGSIIFYYFSDIEYFMSRVDFGNADTTNLSTLVYRKGFELMQESLSISNGLGIGYQQLGIVKVQTTTQEFIIKTLGEDLNAKDGGFLGAKIISEFGIIGIIAIFLYLKLLISTWFKLKKQSFDRLTPGETLCYSSIITFSSELFFRGLGYFTPSVFLFLIAIFLLRNSKATLNQNECE